MFHSALTSFFTPIRSPLSAALPGDVATVEPGLRACHARALGYAAQRRRAALTSRTMESGVDTAYWKAGVPAALARAAAIRAQPMFSKLP